MAIKLKPNAAKTDFEIETPGDGLQTVGSRLARAVQLVKTTDDLKALVAAASAGAHFVLETGVHAIDTTGGGVTISVDNVTIEGPVGALLSGGDQGGAVLTIASGADNFRLSGFRILVGTSDTHGVNIAGAMTEGTVEEVRFEKTGTLTAGNAIEIDGTDVTVEELHIVNCHFDSIEFTHYVNVELTETTTAQGKDIFISGCKFQNPAAAGVRFAAAAGAPAYTRIVIQTCSFNGGQDGINANLTRLFSIDGCFFGNMSRSGIEAGSGFDDGEISDCVFEDPSVAGITMNGGDLTNITGCRFTGCPKAFTTAGSFSNGSFSGNNITGGTTFGVEHSSGDNTIYANNEIDGFGSLAKGIQIAGGSDVLVIGNNISGLTNTATSFCIEHKNATRGSIAENFCNGATLAPAITSTVPGVVIRDNTIVGGLNNIFVDLSATAGAEGPVIEGNTGRSANTDGIHILGNVTHIDGFTCSRNKVFSAGGNSLRLADADNGDCVGNRFMDGAEDGFNLVDVEKTLFSDNVITDHAVALKAAFRSDSACDLLEYFGNLLSGNTLNYVLAGTNRFRDITLDSKLISADQFLPVDADWPITVGAPAVKDDVTGSLTNRNFDDTAKEAVGLEVDIPADAQGLRLTFWSRQGDATPAALTAVIEMQEREIVAGGVPTAFGAEIGITSITFGANNNFEKTVVELSLAGLGLGAGQLHQISLHRDPTDGSDNLVGDWFLKALLLEWI